MATSADLSLASFQDAEPVANLSCRNCKNTLTQDDKLKTKNKYWKSCKTCREKEKARKRRSRIPYSSITPEASSSDAKKPKLGTDGQQQGELPTYSLETSFPAGNMSQDVPFHSTSTGGSQEERTITTATGEDAGEKPSERACSACAYSFPCRDFPSLMACEHIPDVCHDCSLAWLDQEIASATWDWVRCPTSGCENSITHEDVRRYASTETFTRFDKLSMRSFLSNEPSFINCLADGCASGQLHDSGVDGNIFRCAACHFGMCTAHDPIIPFHDNETCMQYNERTERETAEQRAREEEEERVKREQEEASLAAVQKSSVECPGCGANIQKTTGCDHMTCRRKGCRFEFRYICRAPYQGSDGIRIAGNSAHDPGCLYHSVRLPSYEEPLLNDPVSMEDVIRPARVNIGLPVPLHEWHDVDFEDGD